MNPGNLDRLLYIEAPGTQDQDGNWDVWKTDWTTVATMRGKLLSRPGRNAFQDGRDENVGDVQFIVRYNDLKQLDIRPIPNAISNMRLYYVENGVQIQYTIVDAVEAAEYGRNRFGIISCKKTSPQ